MMLTVAVLQQQSLDRQVARSTDIVIQRMEEAAALGADILLLPEVFLTGYRLPMTNDEALPADSPWIRRICSAAKRLRMGVVLTALIRGTERPRNTAFVVDRQGQILLRYDKVHLCAFADECCLEPGEAFRVCDFDGIRLGVMICYDREYPESARVLMLQGAEIILVPNDCAAMRPRLNALSTRAYENMVGVVMANPNGDNAGCSCAFSPICWDEQGQCVNQVLFMADEATEGLYLTRFDMDALRRWREQEMMGNTFRRVDAYGPLMDERVAYPFVRHTPHRENE
ncbi:MAG: carbon-nitrogen hydrolase family protein [Aristaeellaceae bacterium]